MGGEIINIRLFAWALTASLAGFLFGFDTVVISGAEKTIQNLWQLSPAMHGLVISMALWGTVVGALIGGWPTEGIGRKRTLFWIGFLYFVSAVGSAYAPEVYSFMIARFIGGVGVGISTIAAPLYIAEISPASCRGRLAGMFQFNIVFGILVAFISNAALSGIGENAWRWMLGMEAFPALFYTLMCPLLPESPRWLIVHKGDRAAGIEIFRSINQEMSEAEIEATADKIAAEVKGVKDAAKFWTARLQKPILLTFFIAFFNQLSGINAVLYFAPRIFSMTGMDEKAALVQSVGIGITNLIFTFVGLYLIDRLGRRTLLYIGSLGYIVSLAVCSWAFSAYAAEFAAASQATAQPAGAGGTIILIGLFLFIASHAVGQGAVIWVFISEIFPNRNRAAGQALGSFTLWTFTALVTLCFPKMIETFSPSQIFAFFSFMMVLQLIWVIAMMPETKGVPLEDIQKKLGAE